ncbi:MAG TPA: DUF5818 domain-containing protein [Candidatus Acidoferrum sp.]|nr:DUF5818 domain-containing protein [Candidatus Acidoferrum sp.]
MGNAVRFISALIFLIAAILNAPSLSGAAEKVYKGEISDSQCAFGVHSRHRSHDEMIAMGHAGNTPAECTRYCVNYRGGRYVLETKKDVFKLDNQELAEKFAGQAVKLTGTLDTKTNTIQVIKIEPIPEY